MERQYDFQLGTDSRAGLEDSAIRVLLIEDDEDDYAIVKDLLAQIHGVRYAITWINAYMQGVQAINRPEDYDICLLDYRLGGDSGLGLLREASLPSVRKPVILLTAFEDRDIDVESMKMGVADYILKDQLTPALLERSIRYGIERKRMEREQIEREAANFHAKRLESVGSLAAGIAHEINTPIQFVGDNVQFLGDAFRNLFRLIDEYQRIYRELGSEAAPDAFNAQVGEAEQRADLLYFKEEIPRAVQQTQDGVARVATIVRAMKDFSHPGKEEKALADLNKALRDTLTVARNELKYVAEVVTEFDEALPLVWCNVGDVNQVFLNLLVNAAHAIADKVGKNGQQKGTITVKTWSENGDIVVSIKDTGTGISNQIRDRIFDPFFTTKEVGHGTGQGLAIARSVIVEKHGGSLTFESQPGKGTEFFIRLPVEKEKIIDA